MTLGRFHHQSGIALGPILFIVAALVFIAAAIAAGSGAFNANTGTESDKAMAETIITSCDDYQRAMQYLVMNNGCDPTKIDYTPPAFPSGTTWTSGDLTSGNGTNRAGNGTCALYDPRGGGMIFKPLPAAAMSTITTGLYSAHGGGSDADAYAGYPFLEGYGCAYGQGLCSPALAQAASNGAIIVKYFYLNYATCNQINTLTNNMVKTTGQLTTDTDSTTIFAGYGVHSVGGLSFPHILQTSSGGSIFPVNGGCSCDNQGNGSGVNYAYCSPTSATPTFAFECPAMIR